MMLETMFKKLTILLPVFLTALLFSLNTAHADITTGLVGYWNFDEGTGAVAADSSGNGNSGTLLGTTLPAWTAGKIGQAISFNDPHQSVKVPDSSALDIPGSLTVSAWVKPSTASLATKVIVGKGDYYTATTLQYELRTYLGGQLQFCVSNGASKCTNPFGPTMSADTWYHIVGVYDSTSNTVSLYLNGIFSNSAPAAATVTSSSNPFYIAYEGSGRYGIPGAVDDVRVYNRALSASDVAELYAYTGGSSPSPTPVNGVCGSVNNSCTAGTFSDLTDSSTQYLWSCNGTNGGTNASCSLNIPASDTTPPIISSVTSSSVTQATATISWTTNELADSQVSYGLTTSYGSQTSLSSSLVTSHSSSLLSLTPNTVYHYQVLSKDTAGNLSTSPDQTFTTGAQSVVSGNIYIGQTTSGLADGSSCANSQSVAWFNSASNWGTGAGKIGPGTTVHLCGTISTSLSVQGSGAAGNPITIYFEPNARMSAPYWTVNGAINVYQKSYITIDGGANGVIEATNNGTLMTYQNDSDGVVLSNSSYITITDLTIQNMFVRAAGDASYPGSTNNKNCIAFGSTGYTDITVDNNVIHDCFAGIALSYGTLGTNNVSIYSNNIYNSDWGIGGGDSAPGAHGDNWSIHDNWFHDWGNWDNIANGYHHNGIYIWSGSPISYLSGYRVYNNQFGPGFTHHNTSGLFAGGNYTTAYVYNNLFILNASDQYAMDGMIYGSPSNTSTLTLVNRFYNNTFIGAGIGGAAIYVAYGQAAGPGSQFVIENNLISGFGNGISQGTTGNMTLAADNNLYFSLGGSPFSYSTTNVGHFFSWSGWQGLGFDPHSLFNADPLLDPTYHPTSASPAIGAGMNLSSYCSTLPSFCVDKNGNPRPSSGPWDIGAYEYTGGGSGPTTYYLSAVKSGTGSGTVTSSVGGINCGSACTSSAVNSGTSVALTVKPDSGSTFTGWSGGGCSGVGTCSIMVSSNTTVTATFTSALAADTTPPTVSITSPLNNATVSNSVSVVSTASDNIGVAGVQLKLDGTNLGTELTISPYSGTWNTTSAANGPHTLTAVARDAAGNTKTSSAIAVTVNNVAVTPPVNPPSNGGGSSGNGSSSGGSSSGTSSGGATSASGSSSVFTSTVSQPAPTVANFPCTDTTASVSFTRSMTIGATGPDVKALQQFLNTHGFQVSLAGVGSPGNETTTFGPATTAALAKFQSANSISPAVGYFGPITLAKINSLSGGTGTSQSCTTTSTSVTQTAPTATYASTVSFTRDLTLGSTGSDVTLLQQYLNSHGFQVSLSGVGSPGNESDYFGLKTQIALSKYQSVNSISPSVGYFGPKTRAVVGK